MRERNKETEPIGAQKSAGLWHRFRLTHLTGSAKLAGSASLTKQFKPAAEKLNITPGFFVRNIFILAVSLLLFFLVSTDYNLYQTTIVQVTATTDTYVTSKPSAVGQEERYYRQDIQGTVKNGPYKGQPAVLENTYGESLVYDDKYEAGTCLFVDYVTEDNDTLTGTISGVKRDHYVAAAVLLLVDLLLIVGGLQGFFTVLCLTLNILLFYILLRLQYSGMNLLLLSVFMSVLFCAVVLFLIHGRSWATFMALCASLASIFFVTALSYLVMRCTPAVDYEFLEYLIHPYERSDADLLFLSEILMGCAGAVMDIAVTITACASELLRKDPEISRKALISSCRQVSEDITGTMINVVFFTNVSACIPLFVLSMQNDIHFLTVLHYQVFFEVARFLTGSIGTVAAIPFSILAVYLLHGRRAAAC
ncbi:YibE/F family protein [Aminipila butyrica]|uniref:YibE/F family protein n=1 Tax=Aminipila butyrica TaxID=433296 RepID=A0A858BZI2_9FIRM|nr:YibE/F family protein [Aminipila butyrica]QIB70154.1 YibE/F family protein [Aminipila butyrica]